MFTIRRAEIADLEEVVRLRVAFLLEDRQDLPPSEIANTEHIHRYVAEKIPSGEFAVWLAEEDGQTIGTGGLVMFHRPPGFTCDTDLNAMIYNMYTIPECRRRGVATAILQQMVEYLKTTPARRILLYATEMGRPVYERFGFAASNYMSLHL